MGKYIMNIQVRFFWLKFGDRNYVFDMAKKSLQTFFWY